MVGFGLLQFGLSSDGASTAVTPQLAAAGERSSSLTASRGGDRTRADVAPTTALDPVAQQAIVVADQQGRADLERADPTTTTTAAPTTTVAPTTSRPPTTRASRAQAAPRPAAPATPAGPVADDVWRRLAQCESGMRNDGGAPYYGYFQFSPTTWKGIGGPGLPDQSDYETQKAFAQKLQARSGWGQWPVCSKVALRGG